MRNTMETANTPGKRLRFFAEHCFGKIVVFARTLGYRKSSSLYDYFNDKKRPGKKLLNRFYRMGGNPDWLFSGIGSMFSDDDNGKTLQLLVEETRQSGAVPTQVSPSDESAHAGAHCELLFLLISLILYRIKTAPPIAQSILLMYRDLLLLAQRELEIKAAR